MLKKMLSALALVPLVAAAAGPVHEYQLANGLKLIVKEDHRAPVVVSQVWYKVGSSYEHNGTTGISHVLEHMMFQGTRKHPAGEFSRIIAENGGSENAFTSRDYTAYFQQLEASRLAVSFRLEADRMRGLLLTDKQFQKEVRVVMEERRMRTDDRPESFTYERFMAAALIASPYRLPVIGWMNDLQHLRVEDLRAWYRRWYAPNNATVVVVGDVQPRQVLALAREYFGPLKPFKVRPPKPQLEPAQDGERRITVKVPAELPYVIMGYHVPVLATAAQPWEPYALEVLAGILDGGDSARLPARLVRGSAVAASAGAGYDLYSRMSDLFLLDGTPARGQDIAAVEKALRAQIRAVQDQPVTGAELERVKARVVAQNVFQRDSTFYQAMQIGKLVAVGLDWRLADQYVDRIRGVTPAQVQAVARKYLVPNRLTVAVLDPLPMEPGARRPAPRSMGGHDVR
jgi:zinc protease